MLASKARPLLILSAVALAKQLWVLSMWIGASNAGNTHAERVELYLSRFPHAVGELGAFKLTWIMILVGVVGALCAIPARRIPDRWRPLAIALFAANAIFVLWYLFTLM